MKTILTLLTSFVITFPLLSQCTTISIACHPLTVTLPPEGSVIITPDQIDDGSFSDCGFSDMYLDKTTFTCEDIGISAITLTVVDLDGNTLDCTTTITVTAPEEYLQAPDDLTLTCADDPTSPDQTGYAEMVSCDQFVIAYDDVIITLPDGSSRIIREWIAVNIDLEIFSDIQIIDIPAPLTIDGGDDQTVYSDLPYPISRDFSPCVTLSAIPDGGTPPYQVSWIDFPREINPTVCPTSCKAYMVKVVDANGCEAYDTIKVNAIHTVCPGTEKLKMKKYQVCYKNKTLCVSPQTLTHLLRLGATPGNCKDNGCDRRFGDRKYSQINQRSDFLLDANEVNVFPNPFTDYINIAFDLVMDAPISWMIYNAQGQVVIQKILSLRPGQHEFNVDLSGITAGIYYFKIVQADIELYSDRLVKTE